MAYNVDKSDFAEALRLLEMSKDLLNQTIVELRTKNIHSSFDRIFAIIRELAGNQKTVKISDVIVGCTTKGYRIRLMCALKSTKS